MRGRRPPHAPRRSGAGVEWDHGQKGRSVVAMTKGGTKHGHATGDGDYDEGSITLRGAVAMGTGVMIGAGIFALTGQIAELSGSIFPLIFMAAAIVAGVSAYGYVRMANAYPSAGGIAMFLTKAYGPGAVAGGSALLMAFSMVINESLVARTFGTYLVRPFDVGAADALVPILAVGLIGVAFVVNISGNDLIQAVSEITALIKIGGIVVFALLALWAAGLSYESSSSGTTDSPANLLAAVALGVLAYKGFTTITNSGAELVEPERNVGRAIVISLGICVIVYLLVALAVGSSLTVDQITAARDFSLAEAARPALGGAGTIFTVAIAIVATVTGIIASVFAVSRMLAMVSEMGIIPHRHFGMSGRIQRHTLVYTVVLAALLAAFFDLGRIAALGAIFYLVMDVLIQWGILSRLRDEVPANRAIVAAAIVLDLAALGGLVWLKATGDLLVVVVAAIGIAVIFVGEWIFLRNGPVEPPPTRS
ncbi:MAG: APC family permease [Miltoncostaeaceae bacterium]